MATKRARSLQTARRRNLPIDIDLPDLIADGGIQPDNVRALQPVYVAAQLEELTAFLVADLIVERFESGMLSIGGASATLATAYKTTRITELGRRHLYRRALGVGGDDTAGVPNREFNDLWLRFVSAVSAVQRQIGSSKSDGTIPARLQREVRLAGRDLATNLSRHGYGIGYFAAAALQEQVRQMAELLSDPDILTAFSARDMWEVIDRVAESDLGGASNAARWRTIATSGAVVIRWLAERAPRLVSRKAVSILNARHLRAKSRPPDTNPLHHPTDLDLLRACDAWLTVATKSTK